MTKEEQREQAIRMLNTNNALLEYEKTEWRVYCSINGGFGYVPIQKDIMDELVAEGVVELRSDGNMAWLIGERNKHGLGQFLTEKYGIGL